ncbi:MAG: serine/threonine protein kinase [Verrucomicrobiota bacterium]
MPGITVAFASCTSSSGVKAASGRLLFTTHGRTAMIRGDGGGFQFLEFDRPGQVTWQPSAFFPDGRRVLLLSMEARRDGPGRPFDQYYTQTPTHLWIYDLDAGTLKEIATRDRLSVFYTPELLIGEDRMLVQVVRDRVGQIYNMRLDGSDAREFTRAGEGLPYGTSLSPDGRRVAFHLASPSGYQIWTCDLEGVHRTLVASDPEYLFFGPRWSPDGSWLAFQGCRYRKDPGHDWSDACLCRPDGSDRRWVTSDQSLWFAATYGRPGLRGGGSNMISWTRHGKLLFSRRLPDSRVPWEYQQGRPDTDHFNRDYRPELARGGTEICRWDPVRGSIERLTQPGSGVWDFRVAESPDGRSIAFCRASTGEVPSLWRMDPNGSRARKLTEGLDHQGVDHPRWLPKPDGSRPGTTEL